LKCCGSCGKWNPGYSGLSDHQALDLINELIMKIGIPLFLYIQIFVSCSASNRIEKMDYPDKSMKSMRLIQSPGAILSTTSGDQKLNLTSTYLFEEKANGHPQISVHFRIPSGFWDFNVNFYSSLTFHSHNLKQKL